MAVFPTHSFNETEVKFRFGERYISEASNRKFLGIPRGIYAGFIPEFVGNVLRLKSDPNFGLCWARITSSTDSLYSIDVVKSGTLELDFTGHTVFPINVVITASGSLGTTHGASIFTQSAAPVQPTELLVCVVNSVGSVDFDAPTNRDTPFAYATAPLGYGFMPDGSVEGLQQAVALSTEIVDARTDLTGFTHPNLKARLDADASGPAIAGRLGKEVTTIIAEDVLVGTSATNVNVSRSFSQFHRDQLPITPSENIEGFGSETRVGAITQGALPVPNPTGAIVDTKRNICAIVDATTQERIIDASRNVVYGKLEASEITLTGEVSYTISSASVSGIGTLFQAEIQAGDIIELPNGDYLEVSADPPSDVALTLSDPAPVGGNLIGAKRRRYTLSFVTRTGPDADDIAAFTVTGGTTLSWFFPMWRELSVTQFDYTPLLSVGHEEPPVPSATTGTPGKAQLLAAAPEGKAGAVYDVQQQGASRGPHVSSIIFTNVVNAGGGVANVFQRGPTGPAGPSFVGTGPTGIGPPGPQGPTGRGVQAIQTLGNSPIFDHTVAPLGPGVPYSHSIDWGMTSSWVDILFLSGGNARWETITGGVDSDDHFLITGISKVSATEGMIDAQVPLGATPVNRVRLTLAAAGRTTP